MKGENEYWDNEYDNLKVKKPTYDLWLDKYKDVLESSKELPIVDLGCGLGADSLYLCERGFKVMCCDISDVALNRLREHIPNAKTALVDMLNGLPFDDSSIKVLIADLSLHYFYWDETVKIIGEIKRVLEPGGYMLCRLNSTKDINHDAGKGTMLEKNYYSLAGHKKRFFEEDEIKELFSGFEIVFMSECQMNRYNLPKILWEVAIKKQS